MNKLGRFFIAFLMLFPGIGELVIEGIVWLRCAFCTHSWENDGGPFMRGDTTAPFPAVDEWQQPQRCPVCGKTQSVFVGFVMDQGHE